MIKEFNLDQEGKKIIGLLHKGSVTIQILQIPMRGMIIKGFNLDQEGKKITDLFLKGSAIIRILR